MALAHGYRTDIAPPNYLVVGDVAKVGNRRWGLIPLCLFMVGIKVDIPNFRVGEAQVALPEHDQ